MATILRLVNGYPTTIQTASEAYDQSINYASGLAANTTITLPSSGSFQNASANDLFVIYNNMLQTVTTDFTVVGSSAPYTQIQFTFALPNNSTVRFKQNI